MTIHSLRRLTIDRPARGSRGVVPVFAVAAIVCVGLAALVGWRAGRGLTPSSRGPSETARTVSLGPARLTVPPTWTPIRPAGTRIPGLDPSRTLAFRIDDGLSEHAVVTLAGPADRWLIPTSLRPALTGQLGAPNPVFLAGYRAWTYLSIETARPNVVMRLTVVPTSAGVLAVGCTASQSAGVAPGPCDQDVTRVFLAAARVFRPAPELAFRLQTAPALTVLENGRASGDRALKAARGPGAQARALGEVANAYAAAARGLAPLAPSGPGDSLVTSLRDAARAYRSAGAAAAAGAYGDYAAGRAAVTAAEAAVAAALAGVGR